MTGGTGAAGGAYGVVWSVGGARYGTATCDGASVWYVPQVLASRGACLGGLLLVATSCGDSDARDVTPAQGYAVLADEEDQPWALETDGQFLYWLSDGEVRRLSLAGGDPETIDSGDDPRGIAVGSEYLYLTLFDGVGRVPLAGGDIERIADATYVGGIAVSGSRVFWSAFGPSASDGQVLGADLDGSNVQVLASGVTRPRSVGVDQRFVYFDSEGGKISASNEGVTIGSSGGLYRVPADGGDVEHVGGSDIVDGLAVSSDGVAWLESGPTTVWFAPTGGTARSVAEVRGEQPGRMQLEDDAVYWAGGENVVRLGLSGGEPVRLLGDLEGASGLAVTASAVFVSESEGRIVRVAKDGSSNRPTGPITGPCPTRIGDADEIALTPREDENLEQLALSLTPEAVVADQATYERIVADVTEIREQQPGLAGIGFFPQQSDKALYVEFTDIAVQSIQQDEYSAWDCLNEFYGVDTVGVPEHGDLDGLVGIELTGIYNLGVLANLYAQLPGAKTAHASLVGGDGPTICVARDADAYEYVVDDAGGDCPAGCTTHVAHYFASSASGVVEAGDVWDSESGAERPEWYSRLCP